MIVWNTRDVPLYLVYKHPYVCDPYGVPLGTSWFCCFNLFIGKGEMTRRRCESAKTLCKIVRPWCESTKTRCKEAIIISHLHIALPRFHIILLCLHNVVSCFHLASSYRSITLQLTGTKARWVRDIILHFRIALSWLSSSIQMAVQITASAATGNHCSNYRAESEALMKPISIITDSEQMSSQSFLPHRCTVCSTSTDQTLTTTASKGAATVKYQLQSCTPVDICPLWSSW